MDNYVNCNLKPTEVSHVYWLYEDHEQITRNYPEPDGKWMQFYDLTQLGAMWHQAKMKYRAGGLPGIHSMKVSTVCPQPRASNSSQGVIIFYCGPSNDEQRVVDIGRRLLEEMPYTSSNGWMSYKSDEQTAGGTRATGQRKNYLYRIPCPRSA